MGDIRKKHEHIILLTLTRVSVYNEFAEEPKKAGFKSES